MQQNDEKELSPEEIAAQEYLDNVDQRIDGIDNQIETLSKGLTLDLDLPGTPKSPLGKNHERIERLKQEKEAIKSKVGDDIQKIIEKSSKDIQFSVLKEYLLWEDPHAFDKDRIDIAEGKDVFEIAEKKFIKQIIVQREAEKEALAEKTIDVPEEKSLFTSMYQSSLHYELTEVTIEALEPGEAMEDVSMDIDDPGDLDKE